MTTQPQTNLKFGIELECYLPKALVESEQFTVGGYHRGVQIVGAPDGWKAEKDASVSPHAPRGFVGLEIVSPVLQGEDGLAEVVGFFDFLKEVGAQVSVRTGMHVHADGTTLSPAQVGQVQEAFKFYESAFYGLNGPYYSERLSNPYCAPSERWNGLGRYCSLNIQNYLNSRKKTLECRVWRATLEAEVAVAAVVMLTSLVGKVKAGQHVPTGSSKVTCPREASKLFTEAYISGGYSPVDDMAFNDEVAGIIHTQAKAAGV